MSYTFNLDGTEAQKQIAFVRNEIDDLSATDAQVEGVDYFLTDERIQAFLANAAEEAPADATSVEIRLFASSAAEATLAKNQAFVLKKAETLGRKEDGPAVGAEIRAHAKLLSDRAWKSLADRRGLEAEEEAANNTPSYSYSKQARLGW